MTGVSGRAWRIFLVTNPPTSVDVAEHDDVTDAEAAITYLRERYPTARDVKIWAVIPQEPYV